MSKREMADGAASNVNGTEHDGNELASAERPDSAEIEAVRQVSDCGLCLANRAAWVLQSTDPL